ncbi:anhydro-N-acetylmuramic acid kinase [Massilia eurypsychrophila]|uniref:Anhydro-N-acetylmuramic acid kinase n=1 Tax=Massilia eurypsychrophila TaxID=1485217 RepID=A0A2G8TM47_9BURK|nr:anhydro-N-acetylmuramic acid kinase [Massilia eurypsychrophila]PIL47064.1 anhydro-N-acetylmuramic acid kinase [Massilia eurypsychrophila]
MNDNIARLYQIAGKPERHIIGLMSGTSLDGLDIAYCQVRGEGESTAVSLLRFATVPYTDDVKARIREIFARQLVDFPLVAMLNEWLGELHASMILATLAEWGVAPAEVDLIASHGQTVMHAPKSLHGREGYGNATLQIGDGDHIAVKTGIITISDFRQKHIAAGGEGAPLAVYGDFYILGKVGENRILMNLGGIANFTYLPASMNAHEVFVTDTGPGNTLLDACTRRFFPGSDYDKDAAHALRGAVSDTLLAALMASAFFREPFPKTTGPELFNVDYVLQAQAASGTQDLSPEDVLATLTHFSARTIAAAVLTATAGMQIDTFDVYMSGGGMHNPLLVDTLRQLLPCRFRPTDDLGILGDAKEAVLFAVLANETVSGGHSDFGRRLGVPSVAMGKISLPS